MEVLVAVRVVGVVAASHYVNWLLLLPCTHHAALACLGACSLVLSSCYAANTASAHSLLLEISRVQVLLHLSLWLKSLVETSSGSLEFKIGLVGLLMDWHTSSCICSLLRPVGLG